MIKLLHDVGRILHPIEAPLLEHVVCCDVSESATRELTKNRRPFRCDFQNLLGEARSSGFGPPRGPRTPVEFAGRFCGQGLRRGLHVRVQCETQRGLSCNAEPPQSCCGRRSYQRKGEKAGNKQPFTNDWGISCS